MIEHMVSMHVHLAIIFLYAHMLTTRLYSTLIREFPKIKM